MLECCLSLSLTSPATSAAFVSAGREQLGHDSQNAQGPSSSGEFNKRNNSFIKCIIVVEYPSLTFAPYSGLPVHIKWISGRHL